MTNRKTLGASAKLCPISTHLQDVPERARDRFALELFETQGGTCTMCGVAVDPALRGKSGKRSAVVDHIRPWKLRPELAFARGNLQLVCRACHAVCHGIECRLGPDADAIADWKAKYRPVGLDGYRA